MMLISPHCEVNTLIDLLRWRAKHQAQQTAYVFKSDGIETARLTYSELDYQARTIGGLLQGLGKMEQRVLLLYPPGIEYIAAFFGCLYAGTVAIPSYPPRLNRPDERLQGIVTDSQARVVLTLPAIRSSLERRFDHTPELATICWETTEHIVDDWAAHWREPAVSNNTLAFLQYTSGSTNTPKGVMVTHGNIMQNERMIQQAFGHSPDSVVAGWLPIYHDMGLIGNVLQPLYVGVPCYLMSPTEFLQKPYNWLKLISDTKATTSGGPNFSYDLCAQKITPEQLSTLELSRWQVAFNGSEPIRAQTLERFCKVFAPCGFQPEAFYPCYGLAEATLFVTGRNRNAKATATLASVQAGALAQNRVVETSMKNDGEMSHLVSSGGQWLDENITIVNPETLQRCAPDEVGEIWVSGPHVAQGYWQRPEITQTIFGAKLSETGDTPYLRTGDLGFWKDDELFVTGRCKDLIILRGRNYYPQDIELTVEQAHPALQPTGSAAFSIEADGEEHLVVVCEIQRTHRNVNTEVVAQTIRQAISEAHELQTHAVVLLRPMSVPKTSSGKIQRHLCRIRFLEGSLDVLGSSIQSVALDTSEPKAFSRQELLAANGKERLAILEVYLSNLACHVLRTQSIKRQQPLVTLGMDSLAAIELQNTLTACLGVNISAVDFLDGLSVAKLAEHILEQIEIEDGENTSAMAICPHITSDIWPLSFEQERLWFMDQLTPGNPAYHIPYAVRLRGPLIVNHLESSINEIVCRHAVLRASFKMIRGKVWQVIWPELALTLDLVDFHKLSTLKQNVKIQSQIAEIAQKPFELSKGPLLRAVLFRLGDDEHILVVVAHHIIFDITSMALFLRELATQYNSRAIGQAVDQEELPIQYGDFTDWQRQNLTHDALSSHLVYWKDQLAHLPQNPWLPAEGTRPTTIGMQQSAQHDFTLSAELATSLRELSRLEGVTFFTALLAAFYALLQLYSGKMDLCVGVPIQGRWQPETQSLIGFFAYPLPLRVDVSGNPTFRQLLERVRKMLHDAYAHQVVPFLQIAQVVPTGRPRNRAPLFPVMFSMVKTPLAGITIPGLELERVEIENAATDFEWFLTLVEEENGQLCGQWEYQTRLFSADTISVLSKAFEGMLAEFVHKPDTALLQITWPDALRPQAIRGDLTNPPDQIPTQTLAISASFTVEPLANVVNFWAKKLNLPLVTAFAPYNQIFQQLLDPNSLLRNNQQGANLVLLRFEDWLRHDKSYSTEGDLSTVQQNILEKNLEDFIAAMISAAIQSKVPYFVFACPPSPNLNAAQAIFFTQLWEHSQTALEAISGVHIILADELTEHYPVEHYADPQADKLGHIPYTSAFFTALGTMVMRKFHVLQRPPYKVIVLDCDQTLWKGVCGEDGWREIEVTPQHRALQEFMLAQHNVGMLLCLCSKNSEDDVWEVFEKQPAMILKKENLVSWRINWLPKHENVRSLANELGLGLDSFIFVDDNPLECAEMRAACPMVVTLELPSEETYISSFLNNAWVFDHLKVTESDRDRSEQYRQNAERERLRQAAPNLDDFLAGLNLNVKITPMTAGQIERVAQLTQRTNQFNNTTIRRSAQELAALQKAEKVECLTVHVSDRFGDYGLVGAVLFERRSEQIWVDTFLLSCRVLGRRVEHTLLAHLGKEARKYGLKWVEVPLNPSQKNRPTLDFLNSLGETFRFQSNGGYSFRFPVDTLLDIEKLPQQRGDE